MKTMKSDRNFCYYFAKKELKNFIIEF